MMICYTKKRNLNQAQVSFPCNHFLHINSKATRKQYLTDTRSYVIIWSIYNLKMLILPSKCLRLVTRYFDFNAHYILDKNKTRTNFTNLQNSSLRILAKHMWQRVLWQIGSYYSTTMSSMSLYWMIHVNKLLETTVCAWVVPGYTAWSVG